MRSYLAKLPPPKFIQNFTKFQQNVGRILDSGSCVLVGWIKNFALSFRWSMFLRRAFAAETIRFEPPMARHGPATNFRKERNSVLQYFMLLWCVWGPERLVHCRPTAGSLTGTGVLHLTPLSATDGATVAVSYLPLFAGFRVSSVPCSSLRPTFHRTPAGSVRPPTPRP